MTTVQKPLRHAGAPRVLPEASELIRMTERGMTQQEIADWVHVQTGVRVTRASISAALARAGYRAQRPRYDDLIPWKVRVEHGNHYAVRMLRAEARRRHGDVLPEMELKRLETWLAHMEVNKWVVMYDPDLVIKGERPGFHYVKRRPGIDKDLIVRPEAA